MRFLSGFAPFGKPQKDSFAGFTPLEITNKAYVSSQIARDKRTSFVQVKAELRPSKADLSLMGFTLIEIMIVVIIIGVLAGVAVPLYSKAVERSRISEAANILASIRDAEMRYALEYGNYTSGNLAALDINVTDPGKYFDFDTLGNGAPDNADPLDGTYERIAKAKRLSLDAGVYSGGACTDYEIFMLENGTMTSTCAPVNALF